MTVNWPEGSVTVIHFPWADLGRPHAPRPKPSPPPRWGLRSLPRDLHSAQEPALSSWIPQVQAVDIGAEGAAKRLYCLRFDYCFIIIVYTVVIHNKDCDK